MFGRIKKPGRYPYVGSSRAGDRAPKVRRRIIATVGGDDPEAFPQSLQNHLPGFFKRKC
jgi:hypothetical protein